MKKRIGSLKEERKWEILSASVSLPLTRGRCWMLHSRDWGTGDSLSLGGMQYIPNKTTSPVHFRNSDSTFPSLIHSVLLVRRTTFDSLPGVVAKAIVENILSFQLADI